MHFYSRVISGILTMKVELIFFTFHRLLPQPSPLPKLRGHRKSWRLHRILRIYLKMPLKLISRLVAIFKFWALTTKRTVSLILYLIFAARTSPRSNREVQDSECSYPSGKSAYIKFYGRISRYGCLKILNVRNFPSVIHVWYGLFQKIHALNSVAWWP